MLQRDGKEEGYHKESIKRQKEEYWYSDKTYLKVSKGGEGTGQRKLVSVWWGSESPPPCPCFFLFPREMCSAEDRWHCHCLCSCGGFFQMGSWKLLCAVTAFPLSSSPPLRASTSLCAQIPCSLYTGTRLATACISAEPVIKWVRLYLRCSSHLRRQPGCSS